MIILVSAALALAAPSTAGEPGGQAGWNEQGVHEQSDVVRMEALARHGDVRAMRDYGIALWTGQQVKRDRGAAVGWFYEAALRSDAPSMYMLGRAFERGDGVGRDLKLADYWTTRASDFGYKLDDDR